MAPKIKITKEDIIDAAISILRKQGEEAINARSIAAHLECSTQPIFSNFRSMEDLEDHTRAAAYDKYLSFLKAEQNIGKHAAYKSWGMGYIRFAKEERELFKYLFMCDRKNKPLTRTEDFDTSVDYITQVCGISSERANKMHLEIWTYVHGIATMHATSFLELDEDFVSEMLSDVYFALRDKNIKEERNSDGYQS